MPGGNPVTEVPGLTPRSPVTDVAPVLVTVEPARTARPPAERRATDACLQAPVGGSPAPGLPASTPSGSPGRPVPSRPNSTSWFPHAAANDIPASSVAI